MSIEILEKTFDFLNQNPEQYNFWQGTAPSSQDADAKGCLLAWIGYFSNRPGIIYTQIAKELNITSDINLVTADYFPGEEGPGLKVHKVLEWFRAYIETRKVDCVPAHWQFPGDRS